jgi:hypothetical protein
MQGTWYSCKAYIPFSFQNLIGFTQSFATDGFTRSNRL